MANQSKLSQAQISRYRDELLLAQGGRCPLCGELINGDAVLDHDHKSGHVRGVLHRSCNGLEGKIANWIKSFGRNLDMSSLLSSLVRYQAGEYSSNPLHPFHRTEIDKEIKKLQRAAKSTKGAETKAKHKSAISELKNQVVRYEF
jgi:hypothetical protein